MNIIDYRHELEVIAGDVEPGDQAIHPAVLELSAIALHDIDSRYGESSKTPLPQHNALHSLDVARRAIHLTNLLYEFIEDKYKPQIFSLGMHAGSIHDYEQGKEDPGQNERASANYGVNCITNRGYSDVFGDRYIKRLRAGVMVTSFRIDNSGRVEQYNLRVGEPDPFRFIMGFADINGIAMEGPERMIRDATNLYCERTKSPSVEGYLDWFGGQARFLRTRVNNPRIKNDIAYYFPKHKDEVFDTMYDEFHENIISAHALAGVIPTIRGVEEMVGGLIHDFNPMTVGNKAVNLLSRLR